LLAGNFDKSLDDIKRLCINSDLYANQSDEEGFISRQSESGGSHIDHVAASGRVYELEEHQTQGLSDHSLVTATVELPIKTKKLRHKLKHVLAKEVKEEEVVKIMMNCKWPRIKFHRAARAYKRTTTVLINIDGFTKVHKLVKSLESEPSIEQLKQIIEEAT